MCSIAQILHEKTCEINGKIAPCGGYTETLINPEPFQVVRRLRDVFYGLKAIYLITDGAVDIETIEIGFAIIQGSGWASVLVEDGKIKSWKLTRETSKKDLLNITKDIYNYFQNVREEWKAIGFSLLVLNILDKEERQVLDPRVEVWPIFRYYEKYWGYLGDLEIKYGETVFGYYVVDSEDIVDLFESEKFVTRNKIEAEWYHNFLKNYSNEEK